MSNLHWNKYYLFKSLISRRLHKTYYRYFHLNGPHLWISSLCLARRKRIQDSIGFWIPRHGFRISVSGIWIPDFGFQSIISGIPDLLSFITDSKTQDSRFHRQKFPDSGIWIPLNGVITWNWNVFNYFEHRTGALRAWPCTLTQHRLSVFN